MWRVGERRTPALAAQEEEEEEEGGLRSWKGGGLVEEEEEYEEEGFGGMFCAARLWGGWKEWVGGLVGGGKCAFGKQAMPERQRRGGGHGAAAACAGRVVVRGLLLLLWVVRPQGSRPPASSPTRRHAAGPALFLRLCTFLSFPPPHTPTTTARIHTPSLPSVRVPPSSRGVGPRPSGRLGGCND